MPRRINQGRELLPRENTATLNYLVNHARSGSNSCPASLTLWLISTSPLPAPPFCTRDDCMAFRGPPGPAATSCGNRPVRGAMPLRPTKSVVCARLLVARSLTIHVSIGCAWVGRTGRCPQLAQKVSTRLSGCEARSRLRNPTHFGQILSRRPFAPGSLTTVPANIRSRLSQSHQYNSSSTQQQPGHAIAGAYQLRGASKTDDRNGRSSTSR